jgi:hypothetical protein
VDEIVLFNNVGLGGIHTHVFCAPEQDVTTDLRTMEVFGVATGVKENRRADGWGGLVSSFVVISGFWMFLGETGSALLGSDSDNQDPFDNTRTHPDVRTYNIGSGEIYRVRHLLPSYAASAWLELPVNCEGKVSLS